MYNSIYYETTQKLMSLGENIFLYGEKVFVNEKPVTAGSSFVSLHNCFTTLYVVYIYS